MLREHVIPRTDNLPRATAWLFLVVAGLGLALFTAAIFGFTPASPASDAWNYLAAGERLNIGHPLYALSPGDRAVLLAPPYWSVPLLAPPPIAVAWRPLALLGPPVMTLWAISGLVATVLAAGWLIIRGGIVVAAILASLSLALAEQAVAGNVNGLLFPAVVLAWVFRSRPALVGAVVAVAAAVKLTPLLLIVWLVAARRWRAIGFVVVVLMVIGVVSLAGAGIQNHLDWLRSVPTSTPAPSSISGLTGLPSGVVILVLLGVVLGISRHGDERLTFSAAVLATAFASPALYMGTLGIAAAAAAPWLDPDGAFLPALRPRRS